MRLKYKHEIAAEYGFDRKTLHNKMKKCGISVSRGFVKPADQKRIYDCLGYPEGVKEEDYQHLGGKTE